MRTTLSAISLALLSAAYRALRPECSLSTLKKTERKQKERSKDKKKKEKEKKEKKKKEKKKKEKKKKEKKKKEKKKINKEKKESKESKEGRKGEKKKHRKTERRAHVTRHCSVSLQNGGASNGEALGATQLCGMSEIRSLTDLAASVALPLPSCSRRASGVAPSMLGGFAPAGTQAMAL